jgi:HSP20 family molecular chaperone IbpA
MDRYMTPAEYLSGITRRCRCMTAEEMLRNLEEEMERSRLGFGHYLFDDRHGPFVEWSVPGALEFTVMACEGGIEVVISSGPFQKDELSIEAEDGLLEVSGVHREEGPLGRVAREFRATQRIPLPPDANLDGIQARFVDNTLTVRVPRPRRARKEIAIE